MREYSLSLDCGLHYDFSGEELARVSAEAPEKQRWTELVIYRTQGGNYVLEEIKHTRVTDAGPQRRVKKYESEDHLASSLRITGLTCALLRRMGVQSIKIS